MLLQTCRWSTSPSEYCPSPMWKRSPSYTRYSTAIACTQHSQWQRLVTQINKRLPTLSKLHAEQHHLTCASINVQNLGLDWDERVLPSIGNEIVKAAVAQYNAEQLLTQRDRVSRAVSLQMCNMAAYHRQQWQKISASIAGFGDHFKLLSSCSS